MLVVVLGATALSLGSTLAKWAEYTGTVVAFWRMITGTLVWTVAYVLHRRGLVGPGRALRSAAPPPLLPRRRAWQLAVLPGVFFGANLAIFFTAVRRTSIAHAEFIAAMTPLLLLPAGAAMFGEHPDWRALRWGAVSLAGVAIVLAFGPGGTSTAGGIVLVIVAVGSWASYLLSSKRARAELDTVEFMACVMPIGLLTVAPFALITAGEDIWPMPARAWAAVAMLTVVTGIIGHGAIAWSQRHVPVATIGIVQVGQPAIAVIWAFLILGEVIRLGQVPGMALVIVGLGAFTLVSQRAIPTEPIEPIEPIPA